MGPRPKSEIYKCCKQLAFFEVNNLLLKSAWIQGCRLYLVGGISKRLVLELFYLILCSLMTYKQELPSDIASSFHLGN